MHLKGFAPIILIISFSVIALITAAVSVKGNYQKTKPLLSIISREQLKSSPQATPPNQTETMAPTPTIEPSPTQEYTTFAKEAPPSPKPSPAPVPQSSSTSTGANYTVATFNLGSITVVTDSANDDDCSNNCPAKPLAQYVAENGGRAGINGTYFCPPDYGWCSGKVNTYDFPVWNNRKKKWMRPDTLFWNGRGMMVFRGGSAQFFSCAACVGAPSDITGGIVNYPALIANGKTVLDEGSLTDNLKITKGTRSAIGFRQGKLFLVVARSANMGDLVNIFHALGATDALNLDGGGSSALYDSGYKAGPGRNLPNAVIIK